MKKYLEERNSRVHRMVDRLKELRDVELDCGGPNVDLFTDVICELNYRVADKTESKGRERERVCPTCECPIPKKEYDNYCSFCGQFIEK